MNSRREELKAESMIKSKGEEREEGVETNLVH